MSESKEKNPILTRVELVERLHEKGYTKKAASFIWRDAIEVLEEAFVEGYDVGFAGFGKFHVREYAERRSKHPATKEWLTIPAHKTVVFVPGSNLKDELAVGFVRK